MALRFGKNSTRTSSAGNPITTASFTIESNEKLVVLLLKTRGATNRAGGSPTFGGQTMSQAGSTQKAATSPEASAEIWYLVDPPVGANTCTIPNTGAATIFYVLATGNCSSNRTGSVYLAGAGGSNNTSTNPTSSAVQLADYDCLGFAITAGGWTTWSPSARTGTQIYDTDDGADGSGAQYITNVGPGSHTLSWTFGTSDDWGTVSAYFAENVTPSRINNFLFTEGSSDLSVSI